MNRSSAVLVFIAIIAVIGVLAASRCIKVVQPGTVAVASLFGQVELVPFVSGMHFTNPFYTWYEYDVRDQTLKEKAGVPSQDQLTTQVDVSVQWKLIASATPKVLQETGTLEQMEAIHLQPKIRSLIRETGKSILRAEDFFLEQTQQRMQAELLDGMRGYMQPLGVEVAAILIRDISLPENIVRGVEEKKRREQEVEREKAELERFRTEQQKQVAAAMAQREAAEAESGRRRLLADAQAYEIERLNAAVANNPTYLQLQAMEALKAIAQDPSAKLYFINSDSPTPVPLMHIGDAFRTAVPPAVVPSSPRQP